ncbi:MAG TPA: carbamoyl-phosphate synthase (glutamine-hydrolyzing) large subunit [bacterium]|nr:carbamoyl-phosphate synthase (glutamine-hydrolyzing) large subunit [bacterium]
MNKPSSVIVLGSGALRIGQAGEFDYSGSQAIKALKEEGIRTILVNPNVATIQTTPGLADEIYLLPVEPDFVEKVIAAEKPDGILLNVGGQSALNTGVELWKSGALTRSGVAVLGTPVGTIIESEDRALFAAKMRSIGVSVPGSDTADSVERALAIAEKLGYPVMVRAGFSLGGLSSGRAGTPEELRHRVAEALSHAPHVLVEEYLAGWKEVEYEVVRDRFGNSVTVCNMENMDPMGIHTGESIVVAPSQTLTNDEYHYLRTVSLKIVAALGVVGECNVQFALHPSNGEYRVIEINARLSRSSALASKATGYPLAWVATKLALGYALADLKNSVTGVTGCFFEPALDYVTVKIPRWDLRKFRAASRRIGTEMKSVGETMAIAATFEEALQKGVRSLGLGYDGVTDPKARTDDPLDEIANPTDRRLFAIVHALANGTSAEKICESSRIDPWFIARLEAIVRAEQELSGRKLGDLNAEDLLRLKRLGFSDKTIGRGTGENELAVRERRIALSVLPRPRRIDTLAGEFPAATNYLYTTYGGDSPEIKPEDRGRPVMVLGSGPYCIGSSVEFDWCSVGMCTTASKLGHRTVMVNCNPETVSTDYDSNDRLYFEELTLERVLDIVDFERPMGIVVSVGGQIPNTLALSLHRRGVRILGTDPDSIDRAENRHRFATLLDELGIAQPPWQELKSIEEARAFAAKTGYPVLVRPSYVLSGSAMNIAKTERSLDQYLSQAAQVSPENPVVISKFLEGAKEIEIDGVAQDGEMVIYCISEHVELSGVHSGDATVVIPPQTTYLETVRRAKSITKAIARALGINGPFNVQFLARQNEISVIECNLRASRSFPFVSKSTGYDFIEIAARAMLGENVRGRYHTLDLDYVAVKVPQFSFSRLKGADPVLYVEMTSTGESACLGDSLEEAWLKAAIANGLRLPKKSLLVSIGGDDAKHKLLEPLRQLARAGFDIHATSGTNQFLEAQGVRSQLVRKVSDQRPGTQDVVELIADRKVECVINIPKRTADETVLTDGYRIRRAAADFGIPLINDAELARLFVRALLRHPRQGLDAKPLSAYAMRSRPSASAAPRA